MGCVNMTNTPPGVIARPGLAFTFKATARAAATVNVNLATATDPLGVDGQTLVLNDEFLLTGQTAPAQNGLYSIQPNGTQLIAGSFNGSGILDITGLNTGMKYYWVKGNGTDAVGQTTITESGMLLPGASGNITLHGPASTAATGSLKIVSPIRDPTLDVSGEFVPGILVRVLSGTANAGTWEYTGTANPTLGTTALPWTKRSTGSSSAVTPPVTPPSFTNSPPGTLDPCAVPAA
jgi:hypothetical protein